jgi:hypothetical protein
MSNLYKGTSKDASYQASIRSSLKIACFVPNLYQTWPPQTILVSDWLISKKSSPLKPPGQMNPNLVGSILGRSSLKMLSETRIACGSHVC